MITASSVSRHACAEVRQGETGTAATRWSGPLVIGATGGSGTRVLVDIIQVAGGFMGANLRPTNDSRAFGPFCQRWVRPYITRHRKPLAEETWRAMREDLRLCVQEHIAELHAGAPFWGWKNPPNVYLVPFLHEQYPALRFIHVVRDGRDMAFSDNQNQLKRFGDAVLGRPPLGLLRLTRAVAPKLAWPDPRRSIALWSTINVEAADFGEQVLKENYLRVRFEDLCTHTVDTVRRILSFVGSGEPYVTQAAACVAAPPTIGRWQQQRQRTIATVCEVGQPGLERFSYLAA